MEGQAAEFGLKRFAVLTTDNFTSRYAETATQVLIGGYNAVYSLNSDNYYGVHPDNIT